MDRQNQSFAERLKMKKKTIIFLSGTGSNAEALLEYAEKPECAFEVSALFTDRPNRCRALEIGRKFNKTVLQHDIFNFYHAHGESGIGLINERRNQLRDLWTAEVEDIIDNANYRPDFLFLAGFEPLSNITKNFTALNVHPGDLTIERNGKRYLNGLALRPIELAILDGFSHLKSSVIIAQPYTGKDEDVDSGPILGISKPMPIDLMGYSIEELQTVNDARPAKRPKGYTDILHEVANHNQDLLKKCGDHVIFPQAANDYAKGLFDIRDGKTFYCGQQVKTVEYSTESATPVFEE